MTVSSICVSASVSVTLLSEVTLPDDIGMFWESDVLGARVVTVVIHTHNAVQNISHNVMKGEQVVCVGMGVALTCHAGGGGALCEELLRGKSQRVASGGRCGQSHGSAHFYPCTWTWWR